MHDWHKLPGTAYVTSGLGYGHTELSAFDAAELDANILSANAVKVTSFVPPHWRIVDNKANLAMYTTEAAFLPMAYASAVSNHANVGASIVIGVNKDTDQASIIIEHAEQNVSKTQSLERSTIALHDVFSSRGWSVDHMVKTGIEASPKDGLYVCVLVAVVFVLDQP